MPCVAGPYLKQYFDPKHAEDGFSLGISMAGGVLRSITDVESLPYPPRVCTSIHPEAESRSDLG